MSDELPGFDGPKEDAADEDVFKKKATKKGGGFQCMGLSMSVLRGITKRGYKIPTPIQRKTIPLIMEGRDVVAMARTGSGKTACFLIPLFEKLKMRTAKVGARALILSPTRELALQTLKFVKEIGRFSDLKSAVILGGDSMDDQFTLLHGQPDIIVATPGRLLHVCVEMDLKLKSVEYIVFDEADRLFEMGFGEQLTEIVNRLPETRQTVLFSATLPKVLVEFAKAGLTDPVLLRLDVELKIPEELQLIFLITRLEDKLAALLLLLRKAADQQTVVFAATKHHVEYLHLVLECHKITNTYIYSSLDPSARKINAAKFNNGNAKVLLVTDVAARGIDIPLLDNVINFNFPAKAKLFIHRVGRCARAGRSGTAYSLVSPDEYAYMIDLHRFLGRDLNIVTTTNRSGNIGRIPQALLEEQHSALLGLHKMRPELVNQQRVSENAYKKYTLTNPNASGDSNRKAKEYSFKSAGIISAFDAFMDDYENDKEVILDKMKEYRPQATIFEIRGKAASIDYKVMKEKRAFHKTKIETFRQNHETKKLDSLNKKQRDSASNLASSNVDDIEDAFKEVIDSRKRTLHSLCKRKKFKPDENYISYQPADKDTEEGLFVNNFQNDIDKAKMDLIDDSGELKRVRTKKVWDRNKKKLINVNLNEKSGKILTESGVWIPASYRGSRYADWKEKHKIAHNEESDDDDDSQPKNNFNRSRLNTRWARHNEKMQQKKGKSEMKSKEIILKNRKIAEKNRAKHQRGRKGKSKGKSKRKSR